MYKVTTPLRCGGLLLLFFFKIGLEDTLAQSSNHQNKTFENSYRWNTSLDVYNLFKSGTPSVLIRYNHKDKGAYRLKLEGSISRSKVKGLDTTGVITLNSNQDEFGASIGYQWHRASAKHSLIYGADFKYFYRFHRTFYSDNHPSSFVPSRYQALSVSPFIGFNYFITRRLSISAETSLSFSRTKLENLEPDLKSVANETTIFGISYNPLSVINISYHF